MERLTYYDRLGLACYKDGGITYSFKPIGRLAAYEDSGLTPEEVMELSKIVRCGDCNFFDREECIMESREEDCYCRYGERKKNEN